MKGMIQQLVFDKINNLKGCLDTPDEIERREILAKISVLNEIANQIRETKKPEKITKDLKT